MLRAVLWLGARVRPKIYGSSSTRSIIFGAALLSALFAQALVGLAPLGAQEAESYIFGYGDARAEQLQQRSMHHAAPHIHATFSDADSRRRRAHAKDGPISISDKNGKRELKSIAPEGAVYAVVSLADQHVTVYAANGRIAQSRVSTGMPGHPTPIGLFSILGKERWHHSNIYSGAPMPFMQRITWSGVAMHSGVVPGHPASHGCIRLPAGFAQQFWGMTQIGSRVVIARHDTYPVEFASAILPEPRLQFAPDVGPEQNAEVSAVPMKLASVSEIAAVRSAATAQKPPPDPTAAAQLLNPIAYAKALKQRAVANKVAAELAAKNASLKAKVAQVEDHQASDALRKTENALRAAEGKLAALSRTTAAATAPDWPEAAAQVERSRGAFFEAQSRAAANQQAAFAAVQTWKDAIGAGERAASTVTEAERRLKPVSVLISKKEGRVFIRQDWKEVYEAPINFKDAERPIGTHLFIAVNGDASGKLKWMALSVPSGAAPTEAQQRGRAKSNESPDTAPSPPGDKAAAALERIEVPDDVRRRIAELVWIGAQIIVTDNARSDEMDEDSDIIVSTR